MKTPNCMHIACYRPDENERGRNLPNASCDRQKEAQSESENEYAEEENHFSVRKRRATKDRAERHRPLAKCTVCSHPLFEYVQVFEHPSLGVALCFYCHSSIKAKANDVNVDQAPGVCDQTDVCSWCCGMNEDEDGSELFGCDTDG